LLASFCERCSDRIVAQPFVQAFGAKPVHSFYGRDSHTLLWTLISGVLHHGLCVISDCFSFFVTPCWIHFLKQ